MKKTITTDILRFYITFTKRTKATLFAAASRCFLTEIPAKRVVASFFNAERKRQAAGTSRIRLGVNQLEELEKLDKLDTLRDNTNKFHCFRNNFTDYANVGELRGLVKRVLNFVGYRPQEPR